MGHDLTGQAIGDFAKSVWKAFPDASLEVISIGDTGGGLVAIQWMLHGTHTGPLMDGHRLPVAKSPTRGLLSFRSTGASGLFGSSPWGINSKGDISGYYSDSSGNFHGFLLSRRDPTCSLRGARRLAHRREFRGIMLSLPGWTSDSVAAKLGVAKSAKASTSRYAFTGRD